MRRLLPGISCACACAIIGAAACSSGGSARLEGHWRGVRADGVPEAAQAIANTFATGMELDVKGDLITVTTPKDKQSGRYRVLREDKAQVVLVTDRDGPDDKQTFAIVDDKTIKWTVLDGRTITFTRK